MNQPPSISELTTKCSGDTSRISWLLGLARVHGMRACVKGIVEGCTPVGGKTGPCAGKCRCWAAEEVHVRAQQKSDAMQRRFGGLTTLDHDGKPLFNGTVRLFEDSLQAVANTRTPTFWFMPSRGDLFHNGVPTDFIGAAVRVMAAKPDHGFIILTKRMARLFVMLSDVMPLPNVILGVSVWDQASADEALPYVVKLARIPQPAHRPATDTRSVQGRTPGRDSEPRFDQREGGAERGAASAASAQSQQIGDLGIEGWRVCVSIEPMLGPIELPESLLALGDRVWLIVGAASGDSPVDFEEAWVSAIVDQLRDGERRYGSRPLLYYKQSRDAKGRMTELPTLNGQRWLEVPRLNLPTFAQASLLGGV